MSVSFLLNLPPFLPHFVQPLIMVLSTAKPHKLRAGADLQGVTKSGDSILHLAARARMEGFAATAVNMERALFTQYVNHVNQRERYVPYVYRP